MVDTGEGTREINEKDSTVVSFSSTVSNRNRLNFKDHDSFGNTSETYTCTATSQSRARGRRDTFAIAVLHSMRGGTASGARINCAASPTSVDLRMKKVLLAAKSVGGWPPRKRYWYASNRSRVPVRPYFCGCC